MACVEYFFFPCKIYTKLNTVNAYELIYFQMLGSALMGRRNKVQFFFLKHFYF